MHAQAYNGKFWSLWSGMSKLTVAATVPGKPNPPAQAHSAPDSVTVRWAPPQEHGGAPVSEYQLEYADSSDGAFTRVYTGPNTQHTLLDLKVCCIQSLA